MTTSRSFVFRDKLHPVYRLAAAILVPAHVATWVPAGLLVALARPAAAQTSPAKPFGPSEEAFAAQKPSAPVRRTVAPAFTPPSGSFTLPENPTDRDLSSARVFEEPLTPVGPLADAAENAALGRALAEFVGKGDAGAIVAFLAARPGSRWQASLEANLGFHHRTQGAWSKALASWDRAWTLLKPQTQPALKMLGDRTVGELANMRSRLGQMGELEALFQDIGSRDVQGAGTELVKNAREGLWLMKNRPSEAFRCGPLALARVFEVLSPGRKVPEAVAAAKSTQQGICLSDVSALAGTIGVDYQMAYRQPGASLLVPSVIHWKVGHYAALVAQDGDNYHSKDTTFGRDTMLSAATIDQEASGYFLVAKGPLPAGWRAVSAEEGRKVWGKGDAGPAPFSPPPGSDPKTGCPPANGMAVYSLGTATVSLTITDTPVGYQPPVGPAVAFTAHYNHRENSSSTNISNLGPKWSFDWLTYIIAPSTAETVSYGPGYGRSLFIGYNGTTNQFAPQQMNQQRLTKTGTRTYEALNRDGTREIFDLAETGVNPRIFRTRHIDRQGNTTTFGYDASFRLRTVTDALGQVTVLDYELTTDPADPRFYCVTKVTDPFNRSATLQYNAAGQLWKITDVMGIVSEFQYSAGDFIASMKTPYGTSQFAAGEDSYNRWLEATDPLGARERLVFHGLASPTPSSDPAIPPGFIDGNLSARNTFYWNKRAMALAPGDYLQAQQLHWLHGSQGDTTRIVPILEMSKQPLESRVWYKYPGQSDSRFAGSSSQPSAVIRVLDDGSYQTQQYEYGPNGEIIKSIDPLGRETTYEWSADGLDLRKVRQKVGAAYELLTEIVYNAQRLPQVAYDASRQTTTYTYNAAGQVRTVTNARNETTTFWYHLTGQPADWGALDPNAVGYLVKVDGPLAGDADSSHLTYDGFGRPRTATDSEGYTVTTDYDVFDRVTMVTFPDGTYQQLLYNRLDPEWSRDRSGRWSKSTYDALRRLSQVRDPLHQVTSYEWCGCGSLDALVDPSGKRTRWIRDIQSRVTQKLYADGKGDSFTYEPTTGRLKTKTDAKNQVTNYTYNRDNSLAAVTYTDLGGNPLVPATPAVSFGYEASYARMSRMTDGTGTTNYTYHPIGATPGLGAGRLATVDGPLANDTIAYTYDELGRQVGLSIDGASNPQSVVFDALGRVESTTSLLGTFNYAYVGVTGRLDHVDYPNGQKTHYDYYPNTAPAGTGNGDQRLQRIRNLQPNAAPLSTHEYAYDANGLITNWTQSHSGSATAERYDFRYDAANQLVGAILKNASTNAVLKEYGYSYDAAGNRIREQIDNAVTTSAHNPINQLTGQTAGGEMEFSGTVSEPSTVQLQGRPVETDASGAWRGRATVSAGNNTIPVVATDSSGNATTKTISISVAGGAPRTLTYDDNGNLTNDGAGKTYEYDALNRLTKITQASGVTEFIYNGAGQRVQEKLNGTLIKQWIWTDGAQPVEERDASNSVTKRFFGNGQQTEGVSYFYSTDHLGSVREMTDSTGAVRTRYQYDPYGRQTKVSGDLESDFGFTGFYRHQASELNLTLFRAYDPDTGRWTSRDPLAEDAGVNLYAYCNGDPINRIDPLGLDWWDAAKSFAWGLGTSAVFGYAVGFLAVAAGSVAIAPALAIAAGVTAVIAAAYGGFTLGQSLYEAVTGEEWSWDGKGRKLCDDERLNTVTGLLGGLLGGGLMARGFGGSGKGTRNGREFELFGIRFAPFGNGGKNTPGWVQHPEGHFPHYHRKVTGSNGQTLPGQSKSRHRPFESSPTDRSRKDRF